MKNQPRCLICLAPFSRRLAESCACEANLGSREFIHSDVDLSYARAEWARRTPSLDLGPLRWDASGRPIYPKVQS